MTGCRAAGRAHACCVTLGSGSVLLCTIAAWYTLFAMTPAGESGIVSVAYFGISFGAILFPAAVQAWLAAPVTSGLVAGGISWSLSVSATAALVGTATPLVTFGLFSSASTIGRLLIRLLLLPLLLEGALTFIRVASARAVVPGATAAIMALPPAMMLHMCLAVQGRILSTNMATLGETVLVSLLLAVVEVGFRATTPLRDRAAEACCLQAMGRCRGKPSRVPRSGRAVWALWFATLTFEAAAEDVGLFASLALALLFRIPPSPGGQPLSTSEVLLRVGVQYIIEMGTEVGCALSLFSMAQCCAVRVPPVPMTAVQGLVAARERRRATKAPQAAPLPASVMVDDSAPDVSEYVPPSPRTSAPGCAGLHEAAVLACGGGDTVQAVLQVRAMHTQLRRVERGPEWEPVSFASVGRMLGGDASRAVRIAAGAELVAMRYVWAWEQRQPGWVAMFLTVSLATAALVIRVYIGNFICPFSPQVGAPASTWHYDVCTEQ